MTELTARDAVLRILVLGPFSGTSPGPAQPVAVTADNFATVFRALGPRVEVATPDSLASSGGSASLDVQFASWAGLGLPGLLDHVPELAALAELRRLVQRLARGEVEVDEVRAQLRERVPAPLGDGLEALLVDEPGGAERPEHAEADGASGVEAILARVREPDAARDSSENTARRAVAALLARPRPRVAAAAARRVEAALDLRIAAGLGDLLSADPLRRLAALWRGLRLLV